MHTSCTVLILGSGPNAVQAAGWPRTSVGGIVAINNAWQVRPDWDYLIHPEDFPANRMPKALGRRQKTVTAAQYVPAQNAFGGFVYAGGTMAFTAAYWALHALRPKVLAFIGCDMIYPDTGPTHFYGTGTADPLRDDVTLQNLTAKSARLALIAAKNGCHCVNLSQDETRLVFPRAALSDLDALRAAPVTLNTNTSESADACEAQLGYFVPSGRYWEGRHQFSAKALARLDSLWLRAYRAA